MVRERTSDHSDRPTRGREVDPRRENLPAVTAKAFICTQTTSGTASFSGAIPPYEPTSDAQNQTVMDVIAGAAYNLCSRRLHPR